MEAIVGGCGGYFLRVEIGPEISGVLEFGGGGVGGHGGGELFRVLRSELVM
jgi:hypothetical protein